MDENWDLLENIWGSTLKEEGSCYSTSPLACTHT